MFVDPIQLMQFGEGFGTTQKVSSRVGQDVKVDVGQTVFADVFQNAINDVIQTDDAHTEPIAAAKAQLSVELLVQLRNRALEAYNEIMRINL